MLPPDPAVPARARRARARDRACRQLSRLHLCGRRRELGQRRLDRQRGHELRGRHELHTRGFADRPADRRQQGDRERVVRLAHVHQPDRDLDHRLPRQPAAGLQLEPGARGHAAAVRALRARPHPVRRRGRLRHRHAPAAAGLGRLVRLSGGRRHDQPADDVAAPVRGPGRVPRRRAHAVDHRRVLPAHDELLGARGRARLPRALRRRRHGLRPGAAVADGRRRGPARARAAPGLRSGRAQRHRQRRHPPGRALGRDRRRARARRRPRRDVHAAARQAVPGPRQDPDRADRAADRPSRGARADDRRAPATRPTAARSPSTSSRRRRAAASTAPARPRRRRSAPGSRRAASASAPSATGARS